MLFMSFIKQVFNPIAIGLLIFIVLIKSHFVLVGGKGGRMVTPGEFDIFWDTNIKFPLDPGRQLEIQLL